MPHSSSGNENGAVPARLVQSEQIQYTRLVYGEPGTDMDQKSGKLITKNPLLDMRHWLPDIHDKKVVWICTLFVEHTCLSLPSRVDLQALVDPSVKTCFCVQSQMLRVRQSFRVLSSASALEKSGSFGRKVTSAMHTTLLAHKFDPEV